ncbi:linamarin synthase 2-like [Pistacia vera]|uniref:linamarin synthase 2-like n=1 Tax=Pistacia vera TaxID=55513 RepID=UPI001263DDB1|nr:linamarin synthase 2-like [Pistacia vera]
MGSIDHQTPTKPHAVLIPYPAQGHVTPMMQLAKLLHSKGFHITYVNTEFNHKRLIRSRGSNALKGLPDFQFKTIPDGLPPSDRDATQDIPALCASIRKTCLTPFVELISKLNSSGEVPPVTTIVSDGVMTFGIKAAEILGLPVVTLWTASVCGMLGYLQYAELVERGTVPFKDEKFLTDGTLDTPIDWIPGVNHLRLKDLPSFMRVTDVNDIMFDYLGTESQNCLKSSAIIFNTYDEFEHEALEFISSKFPRNNMYTVGPLPLLCRHLPETNHFKSFRTSLWKEDSECLKWLDKQEPDSIVYVNYGSITVMSDEHLKEFAWGLANSKHPFLWILRPDVVEGTDDSAILPQEYFEEIKDRGLIVSWCPQDQVLSHPSIGLFLTHCGWNSTIETVNGGVPVICWPFFAEQQTNRRYACTTWGMGMEVNEDVKRDDIEALVKEMMEGERGKQMRQKAQEWKKMAEETTDIGGKSYNNFNRLIKEAFHHHN